MLYIYICGIEALEQGTRIKVLVKICPKGISALALASSFWWKNAVKHCVDGMKMEALFRACSNSLWGSGEIFVRSRFQGGGFLWWSNLNEIILRSKEPCLLPTERILVWKIISHACQREIWRVLNCEIIFKWMLCREVTQVMNNVRYLILMSLMNESEIGDEDNDVCWCYRWWRLMMINDIWWRMCL